MRAAAIDIGSNTTLALLAELEDGELRTIRDELTANHLGASLDTHGEFTQETIALNVDLLNELVRDFRRDGAEAFALCGTAALRRSRNSATLITAVSQILSLRLEVISGRDEAALTFAGALSAREIYPNEKVGVVDLGGGSTEVIEGKGTIPAESVSLDFGSVRLTHTFFEDDPPSPAAIANLRTDIREQLPLLVRAFANRGLQWTLVGGTSVTLAILKRGIRRYDPVQVGGTFLSTADIDSAIMNFTGRTVMELQRLPGMPAERGKYILAGALLLRELFDVLRIEEAMVSERGLRHGLWLAKFSEQGVK